SLAVLVYADHGRRLEANINGKCQGKQGRWDTQESQNHSAIGVGAQCSVMLVVAAVAQPLRRRGAVCYFFLFTVLRPRSDYPRELRLCTLSEPPPAEFPDVEEVQCGDAVRSRTRSFRLPNRTLSPHDENLVLYPLPSSSRLPPAAFPKAFPALKLMTCTRPRGGYVVVGPPAPAATAAVRPPF